MDPGNWGTDLQGGAQFKYGLLWVVALASLMAIFMQVIAARLGVVTGKDLAQCCRDWYPQWTRWPNWLLCEMAIGACDLAEVLGSAVALNLLFHIPLFWAVIITGFDVLLLLALQRFGMRTIEAVVLVLVAHHRRLLLHRNFRPAADAARVSWRWAMRWSRPSFRQAGMIYRGHRDHRRDGDAAQSVSALGPGAEPQACRRTKRSIRRAIRFNTIDSTVALTIAFFVNAAILVLAAMVFYGKDSVTVPGGQVVAVQRGQRLDSRRLPDAGAAAGHGRWPARCSRWRCWPAARAAPSPARWPGRW